MSAKRRFRFLSAIGPGFVSGTSTNDPTAIAVYARTGAAFGYALCWLPLVCFPLVAVVQEISARIGRTTGRGLAANIRDHCAPWLLRSCVGLLFVANTIAIGADLGAMAEIVATLVGGPRVLYVLGFAALCTLSQIFVGYRRYIALLKWIGLSVLAYCAAALVAEVSWQEVVRGLVPRFSSDAEWIRTVVAVFGVAISPYVFFWQSALESENQNVAPHSRKLVDAPEQAPGALHRIRIDTLFGMGLAMIVGLAIMITSAAGLNAAGVRTIHSAVEAAEALKPLAGPFAFGLFAAGLIGTGLLAIPALAGSAAYAVGEARRWPTGLAKEFRDAKAFYGVMAAATALGTALNFSPIDPMAALYVSAVINGVVAVPLIALMTLVASRPSVMGEFCIGRPLRLLGWTAVGLMGLASATMLVVSLIG